MYNTANKMLTLIVRVLDTFLQVFDAGVVLADGEFSSLESAIIGAPLEMTNKYMSAVAYNEVRAPAASLFFEIVCLSSRVPRLYIALYGVCQAVQRHVVPSMLSKNRRWCGGTVVWRSTNS